MAERIKNLQSFFNFLNDFNIDHAVLGRLDSFETLVNGDIDIVISKHNFSKIEKDILQFSSIYKMSFLQCFQHESSAKYFILSDKDTGSVICPDICSNFVRNGKLFITDSILLENNRSVTVEGFSIKCLSPKNEFLYYLIKKIDKGKEIDLEEFTHLCNQYYTSDKTEIKILLNSFFYSESVEVLLSIFDSKDRFGLNKVTKKIKIELHKKFKHQPIGIAKSLLSKIKRIRKPTGLSVAIMGPDGCGKSTVIEGLMNELDKVFRNKQYYHLMPTEPNKDKQIVNVNPHSDKPYPFLLAQLKLIYLLVKYNIGFIKVRVKKIKSTLIVFDRYFDDILIDKIRFRYKGPIQLLKLIRKFIPNPDLYIYLDAPPEIIYNRKKELPIDEIERQRALYLKLFNGKKNRFVLNASKNQEEVILEAKNIVFEYLSNRQKSRIST